MGLTTFADAKRQQAYDPFNGENIDMVREETRITQKLERTKIEGSESLRNAKIDTDFMPHGHQNPS